VRADFRCFFSSFKVASWQWNGIDRTEFRDDFGVMVDSPYRKGALIERNYLQEFCGPDLFYGDVGGLPGLKCETWSTRHGLHWDTVFSALRLC